MQKVLLQMMAGVFVLLATLTNAQAQVSVNGTMPVVDQQVVFGSQNVSHGFIRVTTSSEKFYLSELVLRVRECSNWNIARLPYLNFSISTNTTIYPGTVGYSSADGEPIVTFGIGEIQAPNTTRTYAILSDVVGYSSFVEADKQCLRLVLDPAGVVSKSPVTGTFPVRLSAKTFVRSKPTITITPIGATSGRVRTTDDEPFLITVANTGPEAIVLLRHLKLSFQGSSLNPQQGLPYFYLVEVATNVTIGKGIPDPAWWSSQVAWIDNLGGPLLSSAPYVANGSVRSYKVRISSSLLQAGSFQISLARKCDLLWGSEFIGLETNAPLCLEPQVVPITSTVSYE